MVCECVLSKEMPLDLNLSAELEARVGKKGRGRPIIKQLGGEGIHTELHVKRRK